MDARSAYTDRLDQALLAKIEAMNRSDLVQLRDDYKLFQSSFQAVYNVLLRKGLIHEDPYKYELKISEVTTPPETPFAESEKIDQMCLRLSQYESYLDFLNNYYQFSVDFLTMGRIKRLVALGKYFNFAQFSETSPQINTRYFAELVALVRKGTDPLSTGILNEAFLQIEKANRKIFQTLKDLTVVHKERYKLELRRLVMSGLSLERDYVVTHREDTARKVRQKISEAGNPLPFSAELVDEVLLEDFSQDSEALRDAVLAKLAVKQEAGKGPAAQKNFKAIVLDGARMVIGVGFQLNDALHKLQDNQALLDSLDRSMMTKIRKALRQMLGRKEEHVVHEVDYMDPVSSERKNEAIDFTAFLDEAGRRAQSLGAMAARTSAAYSRLEGATEDQAYKFLEKAIEDLQSYHRKITALEEFFLGALEPTDLKSRIRSVKVELGSIKNAIIKANQKRHEFIAQREEVEQMKRLGIREA
ncbi:MAG TPA: hypothetical protein P5117_08965 [Spirochaetia bacterium]|nr:hypothetical protein [Spirochaetia bacterium]